MGLLGLPLLMMSASFVLPTRPHVRLGRARHALAIADPAAVAVAAVVAANDPWRCLLHQSGLALHNDAQAEVDACTLSNIGFITQLNQAHDHVEELERKLTATKRAALELAMEEQVRAALQLGEAHLKLATLSASLESIKVEASQRFEAHAAELQEAQSTATAAQAELFAVKVALEATHARKQDLASELEQTKDSLAMAQEMMVTAKREEVKAAEEQVAPARQPAETALKTALTSCGIIVAAQASEAHHKAALSFYEERRARASLAVSARPQPTKRVRPRYTELSRSTAATRTPASREAALAVPQTRLVGNEAFEAAKADRWIIRTYSEPKERVLATSGGRERPGGLESAEYRRRLEQGVFSMRTD